MSHTVSLSASSQIRSRSISDPLPIGYRAVISNSGLVWWATGFTYETAYEAEEAARVRLLAVLDELRSDVPGATETP